jgi:hypothetical protein
MRRHNKLAFQRNRAIRCQRWQRGDELVLRDVTGRGLDQLRAVKLAACEAGKQRVTFPPIRAEAPAPPVSLKRNPQTL